MQIAMGSASEVEYLLLLAKDLELLNYDQYVPLNDELLEVKKMLASFITRLRSKVKNLET
jgi:four helix bundle protein